MNLIIVVVVCVVFGCLLGMYAARFARGDDAPVDVQRREGAPCVRLVLVKL
jgi:hypothetical protein